MTNTSHGWHIEGTPAVVPDNGAARCGGPSWCRKCNREASYAKKNIFDGPVYVPPMPEDGAQKARAKVFNYVKERLEKTDVHVTFGPDEVYVVWYTFVLGHWKALVSTTLPDGMYYEVTYNANKAETYLDAYKKFDNVRIPDSKGE